MELSARKQLKARIKSIKSDAGGQTTTPPPAAPTEESNTEDKKEKRETASGARRVFPFLFTAAFACSRGRGPVRPL